MKFLLGQLANNGDCLYATIIARQIKHDHPDAHVTWAISDKCKAIPLNNPYVDDLWVFPLVNASGIPDASSFFQHEALIRRDRGEFDRVIYSQIWPHNFQNYDGTIRPSILRAYGSEITVPVENVLRLTDEELDGVTQFVAREGLLDFDHRIIFECASSSGQSFMTPTIAQTVAELVYAAVPSACVILATTPDNGLTHPNTRTAQSLSLRQIAALTRAGTLFVGCGSGCTVAATSTAATPLPMIQLLSASTSVYASFAHDFAHYGLSNEHMVEMVSEDVPLIAQAIVAACQSGIAECRQRFHEEIEPRFGFYATLIREHLLDKGRFVDAGRSAMHAARRYGWKNELMALVVHYIVPNLGKDPLAHTADGKRDMEQMLFSLQEAIGLMNRS